MGGNGPNNSGRVTTQQFYQAQMATNSKIDALALTQSEERASMEIRLLEKLDGVPLQVQTNKDEIDKIRKHSRWSDMGLGAFTIMVNIVSDVWRRNG